MKTLGLSITLLILTSALSTSALAADPAPSIVGSYILDYRELTDGMQVRPPQIAGMMTYTKDHRNFNIHWMQDGKPISISLIATYSLTADEYSETSLYYMENNSPLGPGGIQYNPQPSTGKSPVTVKDGRIEIQLPLHGEPAVVFEGDKLTATRAGAFVDHWRKIE